MIRITAEVTQMPIGVRRPTTWRRVLHSRIFTQMRDVMALLQRDLVRVSPRHTGELKDSWTTVGPYQGGFDFQGQVWSKAIQSAVVDQGADPHSPFTEGAIGRLTQWAKDKLPGVKDDKVARTKAFLIARSISRRGLPSSYRGADRRGQLTKIVNAYQEQVLRLGLAIHDAAEAWGAPS